MQEYKKEWFISSSYKQTHRRKQNKAVNVTAIRQQTGLSLV